MRWSAVAFIAPKWHACPIRDGECELTDAVRFSPLPQWIKAFADEELAREEFGEHLEDKTAYCLLVDYEAPGSASAALGVMDPEAQNAHEKARGEIQAAITLLWLARRTSFGLDKIILAEETESEWVWREITSHDERVPLPSYSSADVEPEDFGRAHMLSHVLRGIRATGTVRTALNALGLALSQRSWPLRFVALWLALEGLFGPTDSRETTFRLCQRISLFVEGRGEGAVKLFAEVNESYRWRSKAVHGLRLQKLEEGTSERLMEAAELLVQRAMLKVLTTPGLVSTFDSKDREAYLDNLALI